jgi:hypothetical protein
MRETDRHSIAARIIASAEPDQFSLSESSRRPGTRALLRHFKPVEASSDFEVEESLLPDQQEPEILETSTGLPNPSSTATENSSQLGAVNSNITNSARITPIADSVKAKEENGSLEKQRMRGMSRIFVLENGQGIDDYPFY